MAQLAEICVHSRGIDRCGRPMATYVITGANRGIGYEYCRQLHARGDRDPKTLALLRAQNDAL